MYRRLSFISLCALVVFATACVDGSDLTSAPGFQEDTTEDPLALTFDALSSQSAASGDRSRSEGFAYAAIAVRRGVQPSVLHVNTGNGVEAFDAFVGSLEWEPSVSVQIRAPTHRSLIAWRRTNNGLTRILTLMTPIDSALVLNPLSLSSSDYASFFAGASAQYQETTAALTASGQLNSASAPDAFWAGVRGFVKIREVSTGAACPTRTNDQLKGVTCQQARYAVKFDVALKPLASRPLNLQAGSAERSLSATEQAVNGVRLRLSCAVVASRSGCS
jgi:hypothetical protein